jgi:Nucleotidyltransferase
VQARNAGAASSGQRFSSVAVSTRGQMARMHTIAPLGFVKFKESLAVQPEDPLKRSGDHSQAELVRERVRQYLPHAENN